MQEKLITYYQQRFIVNAKKKIDYFFDSLKNKKLAIYINSIKLSDFNHYIYNLEALNIVKIVDQESSQDLRNYNGIIDYILVLSLEKDDVLISNDLSLFVEKDKIILISNTIAFDIYLLEQLNFTNTKLQSKILWSNIRKLLQAYSDDMLSVFIDKKFNSYLELFKALVLVKPNKPIVALYYHGAYNDNFGILDQQILNNPDFNSVIFIDFNNDRENNFNTVSRLYDNGFFLEYYDFIFLLLTQSITPIVHSNTKVMAFDHVIYGVMNLTNSFKTQTYTKKKISYQVYPDSHYRAAPSLAIYNDCKSSKSNCLKIGYPKLDLIIDYYQQHHHTEKLIVFISTTFTGINEKYHPLTEYKEEIFLELLRHFSDYQVMFRPHPSDYKKAYALRIKDELNQFEKFTFDSSTSYLDNFSKSKYLISDFFTSSSFTYALSTLKPVIFLSLFEDKFNTEAKQTDSYRDREKIGWVCSSLDEVIQKIYHLEQNPQEYKSKSASIKMLREQVIYNVGQSGVATEKAIKVILSSINTDKFRKKFEKKFIKNAQNRVNNFFQKYDNEKIIVYGAGIYYEKFCDVIYNLETLNIEAFTDSNVQLHGKTKLNKFIIDNNKLNNKVKILISSAAYEKEIYNQLINNNILVENIITPFNNLYDDIAIIDSSNILNRYYGVWHQISELLVSLSEKQISELLALDFGSYKELLKKLS